MNKKEVITYSLGSSIYDNTPKQCSAADFDEFADSVLAAVSKAKHMQYVCGPFSLGSSNKSKNEGINYWRCKNGALPRRFLPFDVDGFRDDIAMRDVIRFFSQWPMVWYTTSSHLAHDDKHSGEPRARIILELDRNATREECIQLGRTIQSIVDAELPGCVLEWDSSVHKNEQPNYTPVKKGQPYEEGRVSSLDATPVNVDLLLKATTSETKKQTKSFNTDQATDPILRELLARGMVKSQQSKGSYAVECPCSEEHTTESVETSTLYYLPNFNGYAKGNFHCMHAHCNNRPQKDFLKALDVLSVTNDFAEPIEDIKTSIDELIERCVSDCGAPFTQDALNLLYRLEVYDTGEYIRTRERIRKTNKGISLVKLDATLKKYAKKKNQSIQVYQDTHHGYATRLIAELTSPDSKHPPVCVARELFIANDDLKIWKRKESESLTVMVAERFDNPETCGRRSDYTAIVQHACDLASDSEFFESAPVGLACHGQFFRFSTEGDIILEPLSLSHRQRVLLDFAPVDAPTPLFLKFLNETFGAAEANETEEQILLVQEISGAVLLGLMPRFQKAILFYDPFGRAGKGTLERIIRRLVPDSFVSAVSPFSWDKEYHIAALAGMRLNVVGELPDDAAIPAAEFKTVTGGDPLSGRHPTHRPFTFISEAAHLFMSNHLINTKDHSEAFYSRWLLVSFPNSRILSGLPLDPDIADRILSTEMPGVAYWALEGAKRLLKNGKFTETTAHKELMGKWRLSSNSLAEFIHECCELAPGLQERRSKFYKDYEDWCYRNNRKPFAKQKVLNILQTTVGLNIKLVTIDGYETLKGVSVKPNEFFD